MTTKILFLDDDANLLSAVQRSHRKQFTIDCQETGTFTIRARASAQEAKWTDSAKFFVMNEQAPSTGAGSGYFKLVKKDVCTAHAPGGFTVKESWSVSPTTSTLTLDSGTAHGTCTATYSVPDAVLKPDTTITLTADVTANLDKAMQGYAVGLGADWGANGSCTFVSGEQAYAGTSGSTGKYYPSGHCERKLKIGSGGKIAIWLYDGYNKEFRFSDIYRRATHRMPVRLLPLTAVITTC